MGDRTTSPSGKDGETVTKEIGSSSLRSTFHIRATNDASNSRDEIYMQNQARTSRPVYRSVSHQYVVDGLECTIAMRARRMGKVATVILDLLSNSILYTTLPCKRNATSP